jgi:hypothetical protein
MIKFDGIKRQAFIKSVDNESVHALFRDTSSRAEYKYPNGELSILNRHLAGMGTKRVGVAGLPPEITNNTLHASPVSYGKVLNIQAEMWCKAYRYRVSNEVQQVAMHLTRHPPSNLTIAGHRVLISYEGQPITCYGCGEVGYLYLACPARQKTGTEKQDPHRITYASILTNKASPSGRQLVDKNPTVGRKEEECTTVKATTAAIVSDMETDISKTEKEPQ